MKLDGQLERAQLENIASASPTPTPVGRVYIDTTDTANPIPRIYTTSWRPLRMGQTDALYSQNSGKSCTVNWANGLNQKVVLTDHAKIGFTNPQPGEIHTLVVVQRATETASTTPYMYSLAMTDMLTLRGRYQPVGVLQSSESTVYTWLYSATAKAAYATIPTRIPNPATLPATLMTGIDVHPTKDIVAGGRTSSPYSTTIQYFDAGVRLNFGQVDPSTPTAAVGQAFAYRFHPDGHSIFVIGAGSPYIEAWFLDQYGVPNLFNYADPATLPAGQAYSLDVHPTGSHVVVGHATSPFMSCYPVASGAFGTKVADPASLPGSQVVNLAWSPHGDFLATSNANSPYLEIYPFDPYTGFGTKIIPSSVPAGAGNARLGRNLAWSPNGDYIAMGMSTTPYLTVYPFDRSTSTLGSPTTPFASGAPAAAINAVQFSPCGNYLAAGNSAGLFVYDVSAGGLPSAAPLTFDASGPGVQVNDIVFHRSGEYMFLALNASPFIMCYPTPRKAKNYIKME